MSQIKCCFCQTELEEDEQNNPEPLMEMDPNFCCDYCNRTKVVPARLGALLGAKGSKDDGLDRED
jgi:hypothetical protein